jgi:hypothetical protein
MKTDEPGERFMFASNSIGQMIPMFAQGKFSEIELSEFGRDHDWDGEIPSPPGLGLWVWEYAPTGGTYDAWNGDYDDVLLDSGTWRPLTAIEWQFVQNNESPWVSFIETEEAKFIAAEEAETRSQSQLEPLQLQFGDPVRTGKELLNKG